VGLRKKRTLSDSVKSEVVVLCDASESSGRRKRHVDGPLPDRTMYCAIIEGPRS
jgi:hypothetical protein